LHLRLAERAETEGLYYPDILLRGIEAALGVSNRFVIFYGPPGVGKSRLVRLIADALPAELLIVPVGATWRDGAALLGTYSQAQSAFLQGDLVSLAVRAAAEPEKNFAFCLEDMSLGDPHGYLAPLLCGLECEPPRLHLEHPGDRETPRDIPLPGNIYYFGTLYEQAGQAKPLPRELLDRAVLCELDFANLQQFIAAWDQPFPGGAPLVEVVEILRSYGIKLGYRVVREISVVLTGAIRVGMTQDQLLDQQMKARILPAIQGDEGAVESALRELVRYLSQDDLRFPETLDKAVRMLEHLGLYGYTAAYLS